MASSITGLSLFCHAQSPELSRKPAPLPSASSVSLPFTDKPHFNSLVTGPCADGNARRHFGGFKGSLSGFVPCAIATPNSVLSEEAFKSLGRGFSEEDEPGVSENEDYATVDDGSGGVSEDELAVSMLGLPQRLVEALEKRGITHLFPIQVLLLSSFLGFRKLRDKIVLFGLLVLFSHTQTVCVFAILQSFRML